MLVHGLSYTFSQAVVRPPGKSFSLGLTEANLGPPDLNLALQQHEAYCDALVECGLAITRLEPDDAFPDSTFVEDVAVIFPEGAVLCRPGAPSRRGETIAIEGSLAVSHRISEPGTLDGGDVCVAEREVFIGLSERTNRSGAEQLAEIVKAWGYWPLFIDLADTVPERLRQWITPSEPLLHLKSGMSYLGDGLTALEKVLAGCSQIQGARDAPHPDRNLLIVEPDETYAANCVRVNDFILIAKGYPKFRAALESKIENRKSKIIQLDMSEFRKMDGGLSCLSLRW